MSGAGKDGAAPSGSGGEGGEDFEEDHLLSYFLTGEANASKDVSGESSGDRTGAATAPAPNAMVMPQFGSMGSLASGGGGGGGAPKTIRFSLSDTAGGSSPLAAAHQPGARGPVAGVPVLKTTMMDNMMPSTPAVQFYAAPSSARKSVQGDKSPSNQSPLQMPHGMAAAGQGQNLSPNHVFRPPSGASAAQQGGGIPRVPSRAPSTSSSSSSIASMTAAFASSGTNGATMPPSMQQVHPHVQFQMPMGMGIPMPMPMPLPMNMPMQMQGPAPPNQMQGQSPISPAAMIGTPENMMLPCTPENNMLPPPPRLPNGGNGAAGVAMTHAQAHAQTQMQQQQHAQMIGMQHMNMVAAMNGGGNMAFNGMPVQEQPQPQQPTMQMAPAGVVPPPQLHVAGAPFPNPFLRNGGQSPLTPLSYQQQQRVIPGGQHGHNVSPMMSHPQQMNISPLPNPQQQQQQPPSGIVLAPQLSAPPTAHLMKLPVVKPTAAAATAPAPVLDPAAAERMARQIHHAAARASAGGAAASKPAPTPAESAEKRARRLARNRESARQSRRRKKELLLKLGGRVEKLYGKIEEERRAQISTMERDLRTSRKGLVDGLSKETHDYGGNCDLKVELTSIVKETGPDCASRQAVTNFQYNALRMILLTYFRRYLLWMTTRPPSFFLAGKEDRGKSTRTSSGRISSKQIGEELTGVHRVAMKRVKASDKKSLECTVDKPSHFWPLFAYEMSLSVDQEERWLQAHQKCVDNAQLPRDRHDAEVATSMVPSLKTAVMYQSHSAGHRNQLALLDVLTPEQSARFLEWFGRNKERCASVVAGKGRGDGGDNAAMADANRTNLSSVEDAKEMESLNDVCQRLNDALNIRKPT